jgi:dTDP-4-dehydrorhamnose 3,5-epimerase
VAIVSPSEDLMIITEVPLHGAYLIGLEKHEDERGFFARAYCEREFAAHGLATRIAQASSSFSAHKGTLRGIHYQLAPKAETKVVYCLRGALHDIILDLRLDSPTFGQNFGADLTAENRCMMYVPKGFAHGFLTLTENTEAFYLIDEFYDPDYGRGIRWNDPKFAIQWPAKPVVISERDRNYRDFDPTWHLTI